MIISTLSPNLLNYFYKKNSSSLQVLNLNGKSINWKFGRKINNDDIHEICNFLKINPNINHLNLACNNISDNGLEEFICPELNRIEHLNLMNCKLSWQFIEILYQKGPFPKLKSLKINGNSIGVKGCFYLSKFLKTNVQLRSLDISDTNQTILGASYILETLRTHLNINLTHLNLSNTISDSDNFLSYDTVYFAKLIAEFLKSNKSVIELHLQNCQISGHDFELLLNGLRSNCTLLFLDIAFNSLADFGAVLLADYLREKTQIIGINIAGNGITNYGAKKINKSLKATKIELLDVSHNKISESGLIDLLINFQNKKSLKFLYLWGNKLSQTTNQIIKRITQLEELKNKHLDVTVYENNNDYFAAYQNKRIVRTLTL